MSYSPYECPFSKQIAQAEEAMTGLKNRIRGLEDLLDSPDLKEEQREMLEKELIEIKDILDKNRDALKGLHKENSKTFMVAACFFFLLFVFYALYCVMYNQY